MMEDIAAQAHQHYHNNHGDHSPTLGMRIDSIVATINSVPNTYLAFVTICCLFAFVLLNSDDSGSSSLGTYPKVEKQPPKLLAKRSAEEPQPKWHILKLLNICAVVGLLMSFGWFASNASSYLNDSTVMLKFMAVWSAFLCYFFGFFGIAFINADELERAGSGSSPSTIKAKSIHPPAACTPVCSDRSIPTAKSTTKKTVPAAAAAVPSNVSEMSDEEISQLVVSNQIKDHTLEKILDPTRAVSVRRAAFETKLSSLDKSGALSDLPYEHDLDYSRVFGANCEIVVGYVPLPVGMVGPLTLNDESVYFPMATTEGCLVASTNRGCKAITQGSGAISTITRDGITRAPCVRLPSAKDAAELKIWCEKPENFLQLKAAFESTTSFGKLTAADVTVAGKNAYIRLRCFSGDAMGMNMVSKGSLAVIDLLKTLFPSLVLVALSGNMCTDKKAAAVNWIEGRGKSVVVEATIPKDVVRTTLKTNVKTIVSVNINKNLIGSAMAGSIGGFNAHASNIVSAVFLATGQDPAQNVESSNCMTLMEEDDNGDLWISCTMPSIEVGTVGGGTGLPAQSAGLKIIGVKGGGETPGANAKQLAHVIASAVMAGELSLLAALSANTLVQAHMQHNRKPATKK
jgi:hydroxymethylglutaryl-CoA reductase (NADPH)